MSGVVRTRSQLINQQPSVRPDKKFDAENADYIKRLKHGSRQFASFTRDDTS